VNLSRLKPCGEINYPLLSFCNDIKKLPVPEGEVLVPVFLNHVSCGLFGISEDNVESYQSLDERFVKNKTSTFLFKADGNSMEPSIFKGDLLLVDRSIEYFHNRICVLSYEGQLICKRAIKLENGILLQSDNQSGHKDILISNNESIEIWGVVVSRHGEIT